MAAATAEISTVSAAAAPTDGVELAMGDGA